MARTAQPNATMTSADVSALVLAFDRNRNAQRTARNRAAASAHRRDIGARAVSSALRWAVGAGAVAVVLSAVVVFAL